jgi:hypothetical protein
MNINSLVFLPGINLVMDLLVVLLFFNSDIRYPAAYYSRGLVNMIFSDRWLAGEILPSQLWSDRCLSDSPPPDRFWSSVVPSSCLTNLLFLMVTRLLPSTLFIT